MHPNTPLIQGNCYICVKDFNTETGQKVTQSSVLGVFLRITNFSKSIPTILVKILQVGGLNKLLVVINDN